MLQSIIILAKEVFRNLPKANGILPFESFLTSMNLTNCYASPLALRIKNSILKLLTLS